MFTGDFWRKSCLKGLMCRAPDFNLTLVVPGCLQKQTKDAESLLLSEPLVENHQVVSLKASCWTGHENNKENAGPQVQGHPALAEWRERIELQVQSRLQVCKERHLVMPESVPGLSAMQVQICNWEQRRTDSSVREWEMHSLPFLDINLKWVKKTCLLLHHWLTYLRELWTFQ